LLPVSFYGGLALKEYFLAGELPVEERKELASLASRARIAQLQQERSGLLEEAQQLDQKMEEVKRRMGV
ncbi:hypothetical protein TREMEDRAFT_25408, partial [Tremella mesenterica DSM 1558]|uniref:uncharacterized protein n=1 Tax=Tremella mesenterica (strain ATCC 24925 / CBS 8224 / DSM 1558 / NBRC 9311 / NRRL Y-6157 / RJB 2259-6 / UBC 559-6) TaxID=578456 RepID=UPI0003F4996B